MNEDRLPWFRAYPRAWLSALDGMSQDEQSVFNMVLLRIYDVDGPIGDDARTLGHRCKISEKRASVALERLVKIGKITRRNGKLSNENCEAELKRRSTAAASASGAAKKKWQKNEVKQRNDPCDRIANAKRGQTDLDLDKDSEVKEGRKVEARARATRLPSDWTPSPDLTAYANARGFEGAALDRVVEKFRNYWTAKSGKDATKIDWSATFRNWIITEQERGNGRPTKQAAGGASSASHLVRGFAQAADRRRVGGLFAPDDPPLASAKPGAARGH